MSSTFQSDEDRAAALRGRLHEPEPESWRPDKPESGHPSTIVGRVVRMERGADRGYGEGRCAVIRADDGLGWRVWFRAALEGQWERQAVADGDMVAIAYLGFVEATAKHAGYHNYRVEVDHAQPLVPGPLAPAPGPAPPAFGGGGQERLPEPDVCEQCGFAGRHSEGCPNDLSSVPF